MPDSAKIFVDTSAWIALTNAAEPQHLGARNFAIARRNLVTSNFIIDETITFALSRYGHSVAAQLGQMLWDGTRAQVFYITVAEQRDAWAFFKQYDDKRFSFTDCTSFVLMRRLGLTQAFTFDDDFVQTGLFAQVPR